MGTKIDKIDSFKILPEEGYAAALMLYQTGKSLNCKIVFKKRTNGYRAVFNKQSNNKTLFWMEMTKNELLVKANLLHIDEYNEKTPNLSDAVKKSLTTIKSCENCHPHCGSLHKSYHIDNIEYTPCYFKGPYFSQMNESDWDILKELIILENCSV